MLKEQVLEFVNVIAPQSQLPIPLVMAICEQESSMNDGAVRLENLFYNRYTKPQSLATTNEILLAASYGLMQVMGQSLLEMKFFEWFKDYHNSRNTFQLQDAHSEVAMPKALNAFMVRPQWQIEWGCKWFKKKLSFAKQDTSKALLLWNGGGNPNYPNEVLDKMKKYTV